MVHLVGNWATDRRPIADRQATGDRQLISNIFDTSPPTGCLATANGWRPVGVGVNRLVGMGLKTGFSTNEPQLQVCQIFVNYAPLMNEIIQLKNIYRQFLNLSIDTWSILIFHYSHLYDLDN